uniref:Uncharacterized protein n=1 Tax=Solanum lycopersicum TaxID=4081 RepID=K4C3M2_SOLLC
MGASFGHGEKVNLHLAREAGHSYCQIVRAANMRVREIEKALIRVGRNGLEDGHFPFYPGQRVKASFIVSFQEFQMVIWLMESK